ncbi:hypothetical protein JI739_18635 [Ramlibacter sp. AW1]|uniref:Uncharacterized protein n=1 Tax=Ramlibacter aurantiacus TaxID=2801330 RepID=A0A936ZM92_9BURK|nr:hypothetical protein [Ramlibacter aurantiacus]MBL0422372.1 hypothetical protein [Ramlibacter aurantiacus]
MVYNSRPGRHDEEDEEVIAERMSRLESQMSGFRSSWSSQLDSIPDANGLQMRPKEEMAKCLVCGHFAVIDPSPAAACPKCGRVYEKVQAAVGQRKGA